jgi:hypothetical protein
MGRRWGQRHLQVANSGSIGNSTQFKTQTWLPPAHPRPLPANVCQASPFNFASCYYVDQVYSKPSSLVPCLVPISPYNKIGFDVMDLLPN